MEKIIHVSNLCLMHISEEANMIRQHLAAHSCSVSRFNHDETEEMTERNESTIAENNTENNQPFHFHEPIRSLFSSYENLFFSIRIT